MTGFLIGMLTGFLAGMGICWLYNAIKVDPFIGD